MKFGISLSWTRAARLALILGVLALVVACATGIVSHSFSFNAPIESPGIQILDYRYGESLQPGARALDRSSRTSVRQSHAITGDMLRGDELYVKWRINATQKVYEDTVNLKALLPRDIRNHEIHFTIKDRQLFVYLITPEKRKPEVPPAGPRMYRDLLVLTLSSNFGREVTP